MTLPCVTTVMTSVTWSLPRLSSALPGHSNLNDGMGHQRGAWPTLPHHAFGQPVTMTSARTCVMGVVLSHPQPIPALE